MQSKVLNNILWFCLVLLATIIRIGESLENFADLSGALKTLLIVIDEYDEKKKFAKVAHAII